MPTQAKKRDYYEVLGVERGVGEDDLKKAYRRLAIQFHPDRNPGDKHAEERFKELNEAYQVLSDPERRAQYDRFGHAAFQGPQGGRLRRFRFHAGLRGSLLGYFRRFLRHRARPFALAHPARRRPALRPRNRIRRSGARFRKNRQVPAPGAPAKPATEAARAAAPRALAPAPTAAAPVRCALSRASFPSPPPAANAAARARSSPTPVPSARARGASAAPNRSR